MTAPPQAAAFSPSSSAAKQLEQQLHVELSDAAAELTSGPASDALAESSMSGTSASIASLTQDKERSSAKQRHFSPGTSVVVGIVAAFGLLQSTPRAAVFMSL